MATDAPSTRPWPLPTSPWVMKQEWHDLLFMHWPVAPDHLRPLIPAALALETFDGNAWLGIVPFHMTGIRLRGFPPLPGLSAFPELNVRTYVRNGDKPGVWFFGLDAASRLAVTLARRWYHLPYFHARMSVGIEGGEIRYACERAHRGEPSASFRATYRPSGDVIRAQLGTLEFFLIERYCLYAARGNTIFCGEIDHPPWPLQPAEASIELNTMAACHGVALPGLTPLLHFARFQNVRIWSVREV